MPLPMIAMSVEIVGCHGRSIMDGSVRVDLKDPVKRLDEEVVAPHDALVHAELRRSW